MDGEKKIMFKFKVWIFFLKYSIPDSLNLLVSWWFFDDVSLLGNTLLIKILKPNDDIWLYGNGINEPTRTLMFVFEENDCMSHNAN